MHIGYVWNTTKLWRLWELAGRRLVIRSNGIFDETSLGGREEPEEAQGVYEEIVEKAVLEIIDTHGEILGEVIEAVDDGSKGRSATRTIPQYKKPILQPDSKRIVEIVEEAPLRTGHRRSSRRNGSNSKALNKTLMPTEDVPCHACLHW